MTTLSKARLRKKPRNRAAQEATLINLRALKRRVKRLEARVEVLETSALRSNVSMPVTHIGQ